MSILIIDDDDLQLELTRAALEAAGHQNIETVSEAISVLTKIESGHIKFETYLVDVVMPGIDGIEVCRRIRQSCSGRDASILMVTAHSERNLIDKAFTAGANDYIVKPFDEIELANRLSGIQVRKGISPQTTSDDELRTKVELDIEIAEVGGLVDPAAMNAYIRALDHGRSSLSMATAFCVENWIELTASLVARQKTEIIRRISSMIHQRLAETTYILSYHGAGIFICVSRKADPHFSAVLGDALKEEAEALQAQLAFLRRTGHSGSLETEIAELVEISMNGSFDQNRRLVEPLRQLPDLFSV